MVLIFFATLIIIIRHIAQLMKITTNGHIGSLYADGLGDVRMILIGTVSCNNIVLNRKVLLDKDTAYC
jgi:hypothetical protein